MRVLGGPVTQVQALITTTQPYLSGPDTLLLNLVFASGALGQLTMCLGAFERDGTRVRVYGDRGTIASDRERIALWTGDGSARTEPVPGPYNFVAEFIAFHDAVLRGDRSSTFAREALADLQLIDAALRSAETGANTHLKHS
jgi:predicted dehydrogenase